MDNRDLIFTALMGSRSFQTIKNLNVVQEDLIQKGLPSIPYLNTKPIVTSIPENKQFFPISFSFTENGTKWTFPFEPLININGGNDVTKVNVARKGYDKKGHELYGTAKTRWRQTDFDITISGTLIGKQLIGKPEDCFPKKHFIELFEYLISSGSIYVYSYPLELLGINQIVIESYSFPFTKGENAQAYEIKAVSDFTPSLIIKEPF